MGMHGSAPLRPVRGIGWWAVRGVAVLAALVVGAAALGAVVGDDDRHGEVVRVIDGDTLVALVDGEETTIRLLNVDTPETKDPDEPVQCLGPEASAFLAERLPVGTEIELDYDEERLDRYDRTLAAVYESESLINAEIAAAGLGVPVYFAPNDRFLPEVERAACTAQQEAVGLYAPEVECSLPAQLQAQAAAVEAIPAAVEGDPADALAGAGTVVEDLEAFLLALGAPGLPGLGNTVMGGAHVSDYLEGLVEEAEEVRRGAVSAQGDLEELKTEYDEEQERLEQERREKEEREERERLEREEERRERERMEREQSAVPAKQQSAPASSSGSANGSSSTSDSGATSDSGSTSSSSGGSRSTSTGCVPYGPEIPYADDGGYTGKRHGMPGGKTFRKCS